MERLEEWLGRLKVSRGWRGELTAGFMIFVSALYGILLAPLLLQQAGMDFSGAYTATVLTSFAGTLLLGLWVKQPLAALPSLGLQVYLVFLVVLSHGYGWQDMLGAGMLAALLLALLAWTGMQRRLLQAMPDSLRTGILAGTGLLLVFQGLRLGKLVVGSPMTLTMLGNISEPSFFLAFFGLVVTAILLALRIRGALLLGLLAAILLGLLQGFLVIPSAPFMLPEGLEQTVFQLRFSAIDSLGIVVLAIVLVLLFDSFGARLGIAALYPLEQSPRLLLTVALTNALAALLGTGPVSAAPASLIGSAAGGRTHWTAVFAALCFLPLLFCAPLLKALLDMPAVAAPGLILTGFYILQHAGSFSQMDIAEALPMLLMAVLIPLTSSIAEGTGCGIILFVLLKIFTRQWRQVPLFLYGLAGLFMLQFLLDNL